MKNKKIKSIKEFTVENERITELDPEQYIKLPYPYEDTERQTNS